MRKALIDC